MAQPDLLTLPAFSDSLDQVSDAQLARYAELIYARTGIRVAPQKKALLSNRLRRRLRSTGIDGFEEYYQHLKRLPPHDAEWDAFLQEITTHETYLFRDQAQWDWFGNVYLPARAAARAGGRATPPADLVGGVQHRRRGLYGGLLHRRLLARVRPMEDPNPRHGHRQGRHRAGQDRRVRRTRHAAGSRPLPEMLLRQGEGRQHVAGKARPDGNGRLPATQSLGPVAANCRSTWCS